MQGDQRALLLQGILRRADHVLPVGPFKGSCQLLAEGRAGHGQAVAVQLPAQGLQHDRQPAGAMKVFHVGRARWFQTHQHGGAVSHRVQSIKFQFDAEPAGDGRQVNDGVGGAADGLQHAQGVVEGRFGHDLRRLQALVGQGHGLDAAALAVTQTIGVHGGNGRPARQHHAHGLTEAGHRAGRAHHAAGAGGRRQLSLDVVDGRALQVAATPGRPEATAIGAGADALALVAAGEHGAGGQHDGRYVRAGGAHQQGRQGLVATTHEHHRVQGLGAQHGLHVERHQIAQEHAGRAEKDLAERDDREFQRQTAGLPHAAFDGFRQFAQAAVAVVQFAPGVEHPDDGLAQALRCMAHRAGEGAPQILRELAVAIFGQSAGEARRPFLRHDRLRRPARRSAFPGTPAGLPDRPRGRSHSASCRRRAPAPPPAPDR